MTRTTPTRLGREARPVPPETPRIIFPDEVRPLPRHSEEMTLWGLCHTCKLRHLIRFDAKHGPGNLMNDWWLRHRDHIVDFIHQPGGFRERQEDYYRKALERYHPNADVKEAYGTTTTVTISPASLATSSTWVAGRESTAVDNETTNKYPDYQCEGIITVGTTPTANTEIRVYIAASIDGTTWRDSFTGSDSARSATSEGVRDSWMKLGAVLRVDTNTSNRAYPFYIGSIRRCVGGIPDQWLVWVVHNTGVNLNSTGGNHVCQQRGVYNTVV